MNIAVLGMLPVLLEVAQPGQAEGMLPLVVDMPLLVAGMLLVVGMPLLVVGIHLLVVDIAQVVDTLVEGNLVVVHQGDNLEVGMADQAEQCMVVVPAVDNLVL